MGEPDGRSLPVNGSGLSADDDGPFVANECDDGTTSILPSITFWRLTTNNTASSGGAR